MMTRLLAFLLALFVGVSPALAMGHGCVAINLNNYTKTFSDNFASLSISCSSPKSPSTWYCHKPDNQDFGGIGYNNFTVGGNVLTIPLVDISSTWEGGIISSIDSTGAGFTQQLGYFEASIDVSGGTGGSWPAVWLLAACHIPFPGTCDDVEIDANEMFANFHPDTMMMAYHHWISPTPVVYQFNRVVANNNAAPIGYHTYGVDVQNDFISYYFDHCLVGQIPTPTEAKTTPLYILVDQACSNYPTCSGTTSPSNMLVNHVRVFSKN